MFEEQVGCTDLDRVRRKRAMGDEDRKVRKMQTVPALQDFHFPKEMQCTGQCWKSGMTRHRFLKISLTSSSYVEKRLQRTTLETV